MGRVKIKFPTEKPLFQTIIPVRISDINYGNHLGNDALLSIIHESRMQLLSQWGYTELNAAGNGLIMADVMIAYKGEAFYGDSLLVQIYAEELTERSFDLLYYISTERQGSRVDIAHAKTGMLCFDYSARKIDVMREELRERLNRDSHD
jgi:acyl-CoA thioester hydrolase